MSEEKKMVWTIGHSTRSLEEFVTILHSFNIELVVDVRHLPGSRKFPHFNKEALEKTLPENNIQYIHILKLGGRRPQQPTSKNTAWKHKAFRGYADYMETAPFEEGMSELMDLASRHRVAYMCSEAVWWRCHRSMISDYLKVRGWTVMHIMDVHKEQEHPYTSPARIVNGRLDYSKPPESDSGAK